jgi:ferrous iron transport protein A
VEVVLAAPLGDPLEVRVGEALLLLRRKEAASVLVERE